MTELPEDILADLDCPICDEERVRWSNEIRTLRAKYEFLRQLFSVRKLDVWENDAILYASEIYFRFSEKDADIIVNDDIDKMIELAMMTSRKNL